MKASMQHLQDLCIHELHDLYDAERQLLNALPKMTQASSVPELQEVFNHHLKQTQDHVARLDIVFSELGATSSGEQCEAMKGLSLNFISNIL